jgi:hypothetical protein
MASGKETKEKEEPVIQYSHEVSMLFCNFVGTPDYKLFQISMVTSAAENFLQQTVDSLIKTNQGQCIFYQPMRMNSFNSNKRYYVYVSHLTEEEIIKTLNLKAFW